MTVRGRTVELPTGLKVPRRGTWLAESCPDAERLHTIVPRGYGAMETDAHRRIARGERQRKCPTCGLWAIWEPKRQDDPRGGHYHGPNFHEGECRGGAPGDPYPL